MPSDKYNSKTYTGTEEPVLTDHLWDEEKLPVYTSSPLIQTIFN
jgi:hypothetical protein